MDGQTVTVGGGDRVQRGASRAAVIEVFADVV